MFHIRAHFWLNTRTLLKALWHTFFQRATTPWLWLISLIGMMSHVLYILIKSAKRADGIWEQHILIRRSRICISERENERKKGGVDKILRVLAQINSPAFCPVCRLTGRNIRMEQGRKTDSGSWPNQHSLTCSFHLLQGFCYKSKSICCSTNERLTPLWSHS